MHDIERDSVQPQSSHPHRREWLQAGALGLMNLARPGQALSSVPAAGSVPASTPAMPGFGRAKRCLILYVYGAWSQLDTFDPKPAAPVEIRGEFGTVASSIPGVRVCEHLPRAGRVLDRCTLIRSMSHPWNIHSAAYTLTGNPDTERIEGRQRHPDHWPFFGGVVEHLADRGYFGRRERGVPVNVLLPWRQSLRSGPNKRAGTFGGFLGPAYDPLWTDFDGEAPLGDPFRAVTHKGRFVFGAGDSPAATRETLDRRQSLLSRLERDGSRESEAGRGFDRQRGRAFDLLATPRLANALRIDREPDALRERYGLTLFGQACLSARRLLEAGVKVVTVVWDEFGKSDESWDTHHDHHERMKGYLLPGFDRAFAALMGDLDSRGLLDDTLVLCLSEHGRTPRLGATAAGAPGRDHWSRAYCQLLAGAGVPRGKVIGRTDAIAGDVTDRPVEPKDVLCTAYHLLGIDPRKELEGPLGRRLPLVAGGSAIKEVLK